MTGLHSIFTKWGQWVRGWWERVRLGSRQVARLEAPQPVFEETSEDDDIPDATEFVELVEPLSAVLREVANDPPSLTLIQGGLEVPDQSAQAPMPSVFSPPCLVIPKDYIPIPDSSHELLQLRLPEFEGPLDLLLFLIRRHELDIFDIPMQFICQQYLDALKVMKVMDELNIDVAAEFMLMAAELLHIKSKMLLPKPQVDALVEKNEGEDPRATLVARLLEYQKFQDAAQTFHAAMWRDRDVFSPNLKMTMIEPNGRVVRLREVGVFSLVKAFDGVLKRQAPEIYHRVVKEQESIRERMRALGSILAGKSEMVTFSEVVGVMHGKAAVVVTFLAILEMTRCGLLRIFQTFSEDDDTATMSDGEDIYLLAVFVDVDDVYRRLDSLADAPAYVE